MRQHCFRRFSILAAVAVLFAAAAYADEGMWLFNNPPLRLLQQKYNFTPTRSGSNTFRKAPCGSTAAAPARSFRRTGW